MTTELPKKSGPEITIIHISTNNKELEQISSDHNENKRVVEVSEINNDSESQHDIEATTKTSTIVQTEDAEITSKKL